MTENWKPCAGNRKDWKAGMVHTCRKTYHMTPWGNVYVYKCPGEHGDYDLTSYGADGQSGGDGDDKDVNSWEN